MEESSLSNTTEEFILEHLKEKRYSISALSREINVSRFHLHNMLKGRRKLTIKYLKKINVFFNTNFTLNDKEESQEQE